MKQTRIVIATILIIALSLGIGTIWKVKNEHDKRAYEVVEKRIVEGALECVYHDDCQMQTMTLGTLISKGYAKEEINPKTKLYYAKDSLIKKVNDTFVFEGH